VLVPHIKVSTFSSKPTIKPAVEQSSLRNGTNRINEIADIVELAHTEYVDLSSS